MKKVVALILVLLLLLTSCEYPEAEPSGSHLPSQTTTSEPTGTVPTDDNETGSEPTGSNNEVVQPEDATTGDNTTEDTTTGDNTTEDTTTEDSTTEDSTTEDSTSGGSTSGGSTSGDSASGGSTSSDSTSGDSTSGGSTSSGSTTGGTTTGGSTTGGTTTGGSTSSGSTSSGSTSSGSTSGGTTSGSSTSGGSTSGGSTSGDSASGGSTSSDSTSGGSTSSGSTTGGTTTGGSTTGGSTSSGSTTGGSTTGGSTTGGSTTGGSTSGGSTSSGSTSGGSTSGSTSNSTNPLSDWLYVRYIDVGQGDSILIEVGDCDILIDGGKSSSTVSSYLQGMDVDDIELMINTHPDQDHYGGLATVLSNFAVERVWGSSYSKDSTTYAAFKTAVTREGLTLKTPSVGTVYSYEALTVTVLYSGSGASSSNDSSIVVMVQYGDIRFLFTGDISTTIENQLINSGKNLSCDVLKVAHHGSAGSSSAAFLKATGADYGVISVGSNSYGHPTSDALSRLSSAGINVYRTDLNGTIVFSTNGADLRLPNGSTVSGSGSSSSGSSSSGSSSSGSSSSGSSSSTPSYFVGNKATKKFHLPTCSYLPNAENRVTFYTYSFAVNCAGYSPCQKCLKNYKS